MNFQRLFTHVAMVAVLSLVACSSVGLPEARTFMERSAVAYGTVTAVRNTTTDLLVAKKLGYSDARNVLRQTDIARTGIDAAVAAYTQSPAEGETKLEAASRILRDLQSFLQLRSAP